MTTASNVNRIFNFTTTDRHEILQATSFCINFFDTGTYYCPECIGIPSSIIIFAHFEFALALLVILINIGEIFVIVRLLLKIKRENLFLIQQSQSNTRARARARRTSLITKWLSSSSPQSSFVIGGDSLTLCTFAVCDCLLGEGYLFEIFCVVFTGSSSRPICKYMDRIGVFLIKFGAIYMPAALLNEACIKRLFVYFQSTNFIYRERSYASAKFVGISWSICLLICLLDWLVQMIDVEIYDVYYSMIKYCLLGLDGIFYLSTSLYFVIQANKRQRRRRRRRLRSIVFESHQRWRQRRVWNLNFAVQFSIFFVCIVIFLSVNIFWFCQELFNRLTNESNCIILLIIYKLIGLIFGLGKPFIFFLGLRTIRRLDEDGLSSQGTSLRTLSEGSIISSRMTVPNEQLSPTAEVVVGSASPA